MEKTVQYTPVDLHWKWHQRMHWESSTRCCLAKVTQKPLLQWSETQSGEARATVECGPPCSPGSELRSWQVQCHLSLWLVSCRGLQTERIVLQWLLETGVERGVGGMEWEMGGHRSLHVTVMWLLWNYCYCNIMWHDIYVRPSETKTTMTHMLSCDCHVTCVAIMWLSCDLWPSCDPCCYHVTVMWPMLLSCDHHVTHVAIMWLSCDHHSPHIQGQCSSPGSHHCVGVCMSGWSCDDEYCCYCVCHTCC